VDGKNKSLGARDPDGEVHTRAETTRLGAQQAGFSSEYAERKARREYAAMEASDPTWKTNRRGAQIERDEAKARETARARGQAWGRKEEARMHALRVGMMFGRTDNDRSRAFNLFLFLTGRTDRPDYGYPK
jgi:hypothetical protein